MANKEKYIYELVGRVNNKIRKKTSSETMEKAKEQGKKLDEYFYQLIITCENNPKVEKLYIFRDKLETEKVWKDIEESEYIDKRYLFYAQMGMYGSYLLVNWKELNDHGSN